MVVWFGSSYDCSSTSMGASFSRFDSMSGDITHSRIDVDMLSAATTNAAYESNPFISSMVVTDGATMSIS